ncbi:GPW/gp25 family protein [uncultured Tenacibaculum sp.]|uniref:GPW/gp25 family protein n=1 Tax=uncultured Tenacibaculum sp. TaxID=174713 RepID=UPI00262C7D91|nr:GPW/gp25 family protein [uncultured Tenacibaculum sp.]
MENKKSFLGIGWGFPPEFSEDLNEVVMISEEEDIKSSLEILLSTRLGERVMLPGYGCNLEDLLFEKLDRTLITLAKERIETAILYHEPRIDVIKIDISETDPLEGKLVIKIDYRIRATNSRTNVVFPFYKGEGTDIN